MRSGFEGIQLVISMRNQFLIAVASAFVVEFVNSSIYYCVIETGFFIVFLTNCKEVM